MGVVDYVIIFAVLFLCIFIVSYLVIKRKKKNGCNGDCATCSFCKNDKHCRTYVSKNEDKKI